MDQVEHQRKLLDSDDLTLFLHGGCVVFAAALHKAFGFPLAWLPGHPDNAVGDIYGVSHALVYLEEGEFGIDAAGTRPLDLIRAQFGATQIVAMTYANVLEWKDDPGRGIPAASWFWDAAQARANNRIERFVEYFNGVRRTCAPDAVSWNRRDAAYRYAAH